ncbi:MAG: PIG-L deacetylase family protein [Gaiellaceae bacterium]
MICVVVAHPDDEALSFGGALARLRNHGVEVLLVSLTNASDEVRAAEFQEFARRIAAHHAMLDYPDSGLVAFPAGPPDIEGLLRRRGLALADVECVVTHSPDGNERRHPQHTQTWHLMRAWCREHGIPIGFFAEFPQPELSIGRPWHPLWDGVTLAPVRLNLRLLARELMRAARTPPLPRRGLRLQLRGLRRWCEPYSRVRYALRFDVDLAAKHQLLAAYSSQIAGLSEYESFRSRQEYLFLLERRPLKALRAPHQNDKAGGLRCRS